jgi:tryptophanase
MSPSGYCSAYELATKQWANSTVSLDPIPELPSDLFPKSTTVKSWFKAADVRAFEYGHYMSKYPNKTMQQFS